MCDYSKKSGYFMKMSINSMDIENENEFIQKENCCKWKKKCGDKIKLQFSKDMSPKKD